LLLGSAIEGDAWLLASITFSLSAQ
jgi:hypothetical protein